MESTMTMTMTVTMASLKPKPMPPRCPYLPHSLNSTRFFKSLSLTSPSVGAPTLLDQFDPTIPVERAVHPPSSWYTDPALYAQELDSIFYRGWQAVGQLLFHRQAWTYGLDGALLKAPRITGIQNFNKHEFGLTPIKVATWGPFVLANMEPEVDSDAAVSASEWLGSSSDVLIKYGVDSSLSFICRREYTIECNWKVYCEFVTTTWMEDIMCLTHIKT
ncbi:choline monooxygenase, chloroplastic-like [Rosa rugosa]|uniref:choline monooxygenase, chloroplastic-like n=1 Tax=Rosa rugosa TaxID=74645 RepID=UPI002B404684|nr:choline monooxygenase, chloroplastic-like [Rosa rugosa]